MKKKLFLLLALTLCIVSAAFAEETTQELDMKQRLLGEIAENQTIYAPKVMTLGNGVQVQRTPQDSGIYNVRRLNADNRGCYACHTDLQETILNMPVSQWNWGLSGSHLATEYDGEVKMTVGNCLSCHGGATLQTYIHGIHTNSNKAFSAMGGDCMSCHFVMDDGSMALWDEIKYSVLRGINTADASQGEFSYDFTTTSKTEMYSMNWMSYAMFTDEMAFERHDDDLNGVEADPNLFENWEINISGNVENPTSIKLTELIEKLPSVTRLMAYECAENHGDGALIRQVEVTGIQIADIIALTNPLEDSACVRVYDQGAMYRYPGSVPLEWMEEHDSLLVYEMNGERLRTKDGYPVAIWTAGQHAGRFIKHVDTIVVDNEYTEADRANDFSSYNGESDFTVSDSYAPSQAIFFTQEGQIIEAYEPYTFEGFAFGRDQAIGAMEFSLDQGETWTRFEVEGNPIGTWTYWYYTFTPENEGAYVLSVRAVAENGAVCHEAAQVMVNAKVL